MLLLIITGKLGRAPKLNRDGGRDHYGALRSPNSTDRGLSQFCDAL
jgi:hypothetical protein